LSLEQKIKITGMEIKLTRLSHLHKVGGMISDSRVITERTLSVWAMLRNDPAWSMSFPYWKNFKKLT
jgi:hypothetical protein